MIKTEIIWKNEEDALYCVGLIEDLINKYSPESQIITGNPVVPQISHFLKNTKWL